MSESIPVEMDQLVQKIESAIVIEGVEETTNSVGNDFVADILKKLFKKKSDAEAVTDGTRLVTALQHLLSRQVNDSKLIIGICVALAKISELPANRIIAVVKNSLGKNKMPSISWLEKNIRAAKIIEEYPELSHVSDVEKIVTLKRLPQPVLVEVAKTGKMTVQGGAEVQVQDISRKVLAQKVREVIGKPKKAISSSEAEEVIEVESEETTSLQGAVAAAQGVDFDADEPSEEAILDTKNKIKSRREDVNSKIDAGRVFLTSLQTDLKDLHRDGGEIRKSIDLAVENINNALMHLRIPLTDEEENNLAMRLLLNGSPGSAPAPASSEEAAQELS